MKRGEAGFTLLEVLVGLALLGMLTGLAYGTVKFAAVSWRRASAQREDQADRMAVSSLLQRSISQSYPAFVTRDSSDRRVAFEGLPRSMAMIAPLPAAIEEGVMARERFYVAAEGVSNALMFAWTLDLPASGGGELRPRVMRLAGLIRTVKIEYFGPPDATHSPIWQDSWLERSRLPDLVRVRVWRINTVGRAWIDLAVHPATTTPVDCVYDPVDMNCRRLE